MIEFVLKLKETVSSGVRNISSTAQTAFSTVDRVLSRTQARFNQTGRSVNDLSKRLDDLRKTRDISINRRDIISANREIDTLERRLDRMQTMGVRNRGGGGAGGGLLGMLGGVRSLAAGAGIAALVAGGGMAASAGMQGAAQKTSFQVLGGKQDGAKLYGDVTKFAQDSIFGNELYKNAQTMLSFGVSIDKVMPRLRMLGDISMGDKQKLESLTLAFSQTQSAGRLMGQDLLQYINAGFNPLHEISTMTGVSMANLKEKMEKGAISADMVTKAFEHATGPAGQFYKMTEQIANTPFGKWEAFKGQVQGLALQLGTAMLPAISKVTDGLSLLASYLPSIISSIAPVFDMLGSMNLNGQVMDFVGSVQAIWSALVPVFNQLKPMFVTLFEVIGPLAIQLRGFIVNLVQKLSPTLTSIAHIISVVVSPALRIAGTVLGWLISLVGWIVDKVAVLVNAAAKAVEFIANGVGYVLDRVANVVERKTNTITETLKRGVSDDSVALFFRKVGEVHGQLYVNGILSQYERIAHWMDRAYNTTAFTQRFEEIRNKIYGTPAAATPGDGAVRMGNPGGISPGDFGALSDKNSSIAGGGPKVINITMDAVVKGTTIHVNGKQEAIDDIDEHVADGTLRLLQSLGGTNE